MADQDDEAIPAATTSAGVAAGAGRATAALDGDAAGVRNGRRGDDQDLPACAAPAALEPIAAVATAGRTTVAASRGLRTGMTGEERELRGQMSCGKLADPTLFTTA